MNQSNREALWRQFGASIDMLENAIRRCPEEHWDTKSRFWYIAYHSLFWLDYYLCLEPDQFAPHPPFTLSEFDPTGEMPARTYSREELLTYLKHCRKKCHALVSGLTNEIVFSRWVNAYKDYSVFEMLLYNMRHVQHHTAQPNLLLRQEIDNAPPWVSIATSDLR